jgi:hypothetical protein
MPLGISMDEFLKHFGTKGMSWGIRKDEKKVAKADKAWEKNIFTPKSAIAIHNMVADRMNGPSGELARLNNKPQYRGKDFNNESPLRQKYYQEHSDIANRLTNEAITSIHGSSPSGKLKATLGVTESGQPYVKVSPSTVTHAAEENGLTFLFNTNDAGQFVSVELMEQTLMQMDISVEEFLEHVGTKGMKWGVRKDDRASRAASTPKAQAKRMTDAELKTTVERLRMEQQYVQITHSMSTPSFMKRILAKHGSQALNTITATATTALVALALKKAKRGTVKVPFKGIKDNISFT